MDQKKLKLIKDDPWLEPSEQDIIDRYNRYQYRLKEIENSFSGLDEFTNAYKYFGINYDSVRKGWTYREWAPHAHALYLVGDFNNWEKYSHPLSKDQFGIWEIFLPKNEYNDTFIQGSKIKVLVASQMGENFRIPAYINRVIQDDDTKNFTGQVWIPKKFQLER